jgi:predicted outer membrane repeat protein
VCVLPNSEFSSNDPNNSSYTFGILGIVPGCISNITVLNKNDSGPGSLRQACLELCAGGTIDFTNTIRGQSIVLTNGEIFIGGALTLMGPGASNLTISGNGSNRVFQIVTLSGRCVMTGLTIANGRSLGPGGAGVLTRGTLILENCAFNNNRTAGSGGAVHSFSSDGRVIVDGCTFSANSADGWGGAIYSGFRGIVTLTNSTLSDNSAAQGGGIYSEQLGTLTLIHCTLRGNAAIAGGGIFNFSGSVTIGHTLLSKGTNGINYWGSSVSITNLGFNLSDDNSATNSFIPNAGNLLLGPLANNGGPTLTHALLPGSPAIDAGTNMAATDSLYDQRGPGFRRFVNGRMDIGAYEVQAPLAFVRANWEAQGFRFVVQGEPNEILHIQWNAQPGTAGWNPLTLRSTDGAGLLQFTDTDTNGESRRFYRAVRP